MARKSKRARQQSVPPPLTEAQKTAHRKELLAIIAKFEDERAPHIELSINERRFIRETLEWAWLPKHVQRKLLRQRQLESIEALETLLKHASATLTPTRTPITADVRAEIVRDFHGFPSKQAVARFKKRER